MNRLFCVLFCILFSINAFAQQSPPADGAVPRLIRFSGQLKSDSGTAGITFSLHRAQQDDQPLWSETQNVQLDAAGRYTVLLGSTKATGIPAELFNSGEAQWLAIRVEGHTEQPRVLLVSVPYALKAAEAETLAGHAATEFVTADKLSSAVAQQVEKSHSEAAKPNVVNGVITTTATNFIDTTTNQVVGVTQNGTGEAIIATAKSNTAISGIATGTTGATIGVLGQSASTSGTGVRGYASASTGNTVGLFGSAASSSGIAIAATESSPGGSTLGIEATVNSANGIGAVVQNKAGGKLISGRSGSSNTEVFSVAGNGTINLAGSGGVPMILGDIGCGSGYVGISIATPSNCNTAILFNDGASAVLQAQPGGSIFFQQGGNQFGYIGYGGGVTFYAPTTQVDGIDIYGHSDFSGGTATAGGVFVGGSSNGSGAAGVRAQGGFNGAPGVYSIGGTGGDGLFAEAGLGSGYAGNFSGNVNVTGTLSAGSKNFKIDHPLDPANKYLNHASVESSEQKNIYDGTVLLDASGRAVVALPNWFEALNGDFRYQLTAIGAPGPNLYVAEEVHDGKFVIAGGQPGAKVSWQITGVRHDAFAQHNPLVVEAEKPAQERGYYIHPEYYGAAPEKQIEYAHDPQRARKK